MDYAQIVALMKRGQDHFKEMTHLLASHRISLINETLRTHDRARMKVDNYIPDTQGEILEQALRPLRMVQGAVQEALGKMPETAQMVFDMQPFKDMLGQTTASAMVDQSTQMHKIDILEDINTGTGPLREETVRTLGTLRAGLMDSYAKLRDQEPIDLSAMAQDEEALPLGGAIILVTLNVVEAISNGVTEHSGLKATLNPPVSEEEKQALETYLHENETFFGVLVEAMGGAPSKDSLDI